MAGGRSVRRLTQHLREQLLQGRLLPLGCSSSSGSFDDEFFLEICFQRTWKPVPNDTNTHTQSPTHKHTHSITHSLTPSLPPSLTHPLTQFASLPSSSSSSSCASDVYQPQGMQKEFTKCAAALERVQNITLVSESMVSTPSF